MTSDVIDQLEEQIGAPSARGEVSDELVAILRGDPDARKDWERVRIESVSTLERNAIDPKKFLDRAFELYSLPAYDNNCTPEKVLGALIKSGKFHIRSKSILVSKLNPSTPRVWAVDPIGDSSISSTEFLVMKPNENIVDFRYFFYLLGSRQGIGALASSASGTSGSHQRIKPTDLLSLEVYLPPLQIQKQIADLLSVFDEKIELLRAQNKTLESIAQAIYKRWFVDFEFPMAEEDARALGKSELAGQPYKSSGGKMKSSALGEIPEDWEVKPLSSIAEFLNGLAMQKFPAVPGEETLPVIKIRELNQGVTDVTDIASRHIPEKYVVDFGDLLFSWSGSLELKIWDGPQGALNQHLFKVTSQDSPTWFVYQTVKKFLPEFRDIAANKATTMGHIQRHHLDDAILPVPVVFDADFVLPNSLFDRQVNNMLAMNVAKHTLRSIKARII